MNANLLLVLSIAIAEPQPTNQRKDLADAECVALASCSYLEGDTHALVELELAKALLEEPHRGYRYVFRLFKLAASHETRKNRRRGLLAELPDIPTHNRIGAPDPVRAGALVVDSEGQRIFVIISKSIGGHVILRAYGFALGESAEQVVAQKVPPRPFAQIEDHGGETDGSVRSLTAHIEENAILITAKASDTDARDREFLLDLGTKSLSKKRTGR
ncbi:MAG: hypothetical protein JSU86_07005 [Phycisphaerales bacterium]|nr:MAG: hypothetical protein JSU86_07005 [Phycisphaerales bacterium]